MQPIKRITVEDRERAIFKYLKSLDTDGKGATVKEIWEAVCAQLGDDVTQQAYYKLLDRLVAVGKLDRADEMTEDGGKRYIVAPHLHAETAVTLDDVYELMAVIPPSEAIARLMDARDYFESQKNRTLKRAALALLEEEPLDLVEAFLLHRIERLNADLSLLRERSLVGPELDARVESQSLELQDLTYRSLGLSRAAIDVPRPETRKTSKPDVRVNKAILRKELEFRVFGPRFISAIDASSLRDNKEMSRMTVAGSDGSTHASVMQLTTTQNFTDEIGHQVITFNNSVVYVDIPPAIKKTIEFPYYSVPMNRAAIDDRSNRGMVLAPFMFRYLSESEYEHMAKCANDVVQWRADATVFLGTGRALHGGELLPGPTVHFRDGTITPQEREWGHYKRPNAYGEMVREGIALSRNILDRIISTTNPPIFAGAVKATQRRFFSTILNWYISIGSRRRFGKPLDPHWDTTRAAYIPDTEAMSFLLASLEDIRQKDEYYVTCAVMRPFHTLTEYFATPKTSDYDWAAHFERVKDKELESYDENLQNELPYLATVPSVADENFVHMCATADYTAFFIGHTAGDPPPVAPRYEFLEGLRRMPNREAAQARVLRNMEMIVSALDRTKFSMDRERNFLSSKFLVKVIPYVIFNAHEKCKALGRQLEAELRSLAIANLSIIKQMHGLRSSDIQFVPINIRKFVERYAKLLTEENRRDPSSYQR